MWWKQSLLLLASLHTMYVRAGRRQQGLIAMKGREVILLDQNLSPPTYHWSSAGMLVTKIISAKELLGKLQTSKNKDFATGDPITPDPYSESVSLNQCQAACETDSSCEGIIRKASEGQGAGICYKRKNI